MIVQADLAVRDVLRDGFAQVVADLQLIDEIFAARPVDERQVLKDFLAANPIVVELGYPSQEAQLPGLWVTLGGGPEALSPIGERFGDEDAGALGLVETTGVYLQSVVRILCLALNMDLVVWIQAITTWILLGARNRLTDSGLLEQTLSVSDLEPLPQVYPPDFAFRRDVVLVAKTEATVETTVPKLAGVTVTGTAYGAGAEGVTIARRR